jgi:heptosyltransferase-3
LSYGNYPSLEGVSRILVIKLRHLGDVLLTTPIFTTLESRFPGVKIDGYIYKESAPMLSGVEGVEELILYDRKWKELPKWRRLVHEARVLRKIRRKGYDMVINLTEGDRGAIAAQVSRAPIRVGFDPEGKGLKGKRKIYTHIVKNCPTPRHAVERGLDALRRIGIFPGFHERELTFSVPDSAREAACKLCEGPYAVMHPVSRWRFKCPPPQLMAGVIGLLSEKGIKVVLTGGGSPEERDFVAQIISLCKEGEVVDLSGQTSLKELGALFERSLGLITVDSVSLHMASALKVPVVALFGPTSEENWGPWMHPKSAVITSGHRCRPCGLDGCGGSKMSDCLWALSIQEIVEKFQAVVLASASSKAAAASLFSLNSLET